MFTFAGHAHMVSLPSAKCLTDQAGPHGHATLRASDTIGSEACHHLIKATVQKLSDLLARVPSRPPATSPLRHSK
eukprot:365069-Chlamydomonas_euryale.AAC.14